MNIIQLYQDYNINFQTEGHKHCRPGWVNTECPFCTGNPGLHLGVPINGGWFKCWRCGSHPPVETLSKLLHVSKPEARKLLIQYAGVSASDQKQKIIIRKKAFKLPSNSNPLLPAHKKYLKRRGFDADYLEQKWGLLGTSIYSKLDKIDYSRRIVAPVYWNDKIVTFQTRDITEKHPMKYLACSEAREGINIKRTLYGNQSAWKDTGICVEGITDVWRFGDNSFSTYGIKYTHAQVRLISKYFKNVAVCFDGGEEQALIQANSLVADLKFRGVNAWREDIEGDPADMTQNEADEFVNKIMNKIKS